MMKDYKQVTTYSLVKSHELLYDAIEDIEVEIELREAKLRHLKLGYGEGIDGMLTPTSTGYHGAWLAFYALKLPY
jgi:hypothetical protein